MSCNVILCMSMFDTHPDYEIQQIMKGVKLCPQPLGTIFQLIPLSSSNFLLILTYCPCRQNLGDMAMAELGEGCPLLKEVLLSYCRQISDVGITHLVKNCNLLESCQMVYCPAITAAGVATVVSGCPNVKKVLVEKWKVSQRTKRRAGSVIAYLCMDL